MFNNWNNHLKTTAQVKLETIVQNKALPDIWHETLKWLGFESLFSLEAWISTKIATLKKNNQPANRFFFNGIFLKQTQAFHATKCEQVSASPRQNLAGRNHATQRFSKRHKASPSSSTTSTSSNSACSTCWSRSSALLFWNFMILWIFMGKTMCLGA